MFKSQRYKASALIPTWFELILFTLLGIIFMVIATYGKIAAYYGFTGIQLTMPAFIIQFEDKLDTNILPVLITAMAWGLVGFLVYIGFWVSIDTIFRASDASPKFHNYVFANNEQRHRFKVTVFGQIYLRILAVGLLIIWFIMLFKLLPIFGIFFYTLFVSPAFDKNLLACISALILMGLYLFLIAPLTRLIFLRPRLFSDN